MSLIAIAQGSKNSPVFGTSTKSLRTSQSRHWRLKSRGFKKSRRKYRKQRIGVIERWKAQWWNIGKSIVIESLLLSVTRVSTLLGAQQLTSATGFFFERDGRLFLVTNRHVVLDEASDHRPDRLEIELHIDPENVAATTHFSIPLYRGTQPVWREGIDPAGTVDVVALQLERAALPEKLLLQPFRSNHLIDQLDEIEVGTRVLIVGFPLGFHDTWHHLPVVRQAVIASAFGLRCQGHGYFLTDARMHRGTSGAPVVARQSGQQSGRGDLPWMLLGVHAARMDVTNRDVEQDERLNLNCAWYTDIIMTLTEERQKMGQWSWNIGMMEEQTFLRFSTIPLFQCSNSLYLL